MTTELIPAATELTFGIVTIPSTQAMLDKIAFDLDESKTFVIDSEGMAGIALEMCGRFATVRDALDKERLATTLPLRDGVAKINGGYNPAIDMIEAQEKGLKIKLTAWNQHVIRIRRELEAKAETERRAAAKLVEEEAARQRAAAAQLVADAQAANAAGNVDKAADLIVQAQVTSDAAQQTAQAAQVTLHTPTLNSGPSTVKGASETWKARVTDKAALIQSIANSIQGGDLSRIELLIVNETALNALARVQKANMNMAGVEAYPESNVRARRQSV